MQDPRVLGVALRAVAAAIPNGRVATLPGSFPCDCAWGAYVPK